MAPLSVSSVQRHKDLLKSWRWVDVKSPKSELCRFLHESICVDCTSSLSIAVLCQSKYQNGEITVVEKFLSVTEEWTRTSEKVKNEAVTNFQDLQLALQTPFAFVCADHYDCTRIVVFSLREWWMVEVDACCVCICDIEEHPYHSTCKQLQATWLWKNIWLLWFEDRHVSWGQQSRQPGLQLNQRNVTEVLCHVGVFVTVSRNVLVFYGWYFRML